ncbi:Conserved hypothetical protein [Clostridium neonatale]|uniref:DHHW family protein n=1 Tax=Clostridium neonatale TaxID=137838 RepID=UPI00291B59B7|nr:Conserved hypothetical protein [Clostridium neonatale]
MKKNLLLYCFFIVLLGFTGLDIFKSDKNFSELENRYLKSRPKFTLKRYIEGSFPEKYENYMSDQFIGRDMWINLKSRSEYALGKIENNNIIYGNENFLFEKLTSMDKKRVDSNINSINIFVENSDFKVSIMIVPNSYTIYKEKLPLFAPVLNGKEEISNIYSRLKGTHNINLFESMNNKKDNELLYYKNDHHWTTEGAYLGYLEYAKSMGKEPIKLNQYEKNMCEDFLGTYYSKAKPFKYEFDTLTYYNFPGIKMNINEKTYNSLYDHTKLNIRDKYSLFLYGNNPLTIIKNDNSINKDKLLIVKDSYANCMIPFLTQSFEEIHSFDLRSFSEIVNEYAKENKLYNVLIIYNFNNFIKDADITRIKK